MSELSAAQGPAELQVEPLVRQCASSKVPGSARNILFVSDYDGTLAPFHPDPAQAKPDPQAWEGFCSLGQVPGITTALLSGRTRADLIELTGFDPRFIVGSHGAELPDGSGITLTKDQRSNYEHIRRIFTSYLPELPGSWIEEKQTGLALHTRSCDPTLAANWEPRIAAQVQALAAVRVTAGKRVIEAGVVHATKADGIAWLIAHHSPLDAVWFVGDDTTDEHAFSWLNTHHPDMSTSVKIGSGPTKAQFYLPNIASYGTFLNTMAQSLL